MYKILLILLFCQSSFAKEISVASYNTWLLPAILMKADQPNKRSKAIANYFKDQNFDIIALQEVFRKKYYNNINRVLKEHDYYSSGTPDKRFFKAISSGLTIFSKYPIVEEKFFKFNRCASFDCYAAKGVLAVRINIDGKKINVVTTHMQAGKSDLKAEIRRSQIDQLAFFLQNDFFKDNYPIILLGDFNINMYKDYNYRYLYSKIDLVPHDYVGELSYTSDGELNDHKLGRDRKSVDYIFLSNNENKINLLDNIIFRPRSIYNQKDELDLSDHFAVKTKIEIN